MKIILLEDVQDVGKKYEIKEVKDGHARNFLFPNNLAKPATKQNLEWLKTNKEEAKKAAEENLKEAQELATKLDGVEVTIHMNVGEEGQLFESVNAQKIAEQLKVMGFEVKKSQIILENPIKEAGEFPIKISLDHNLEVEVQLIVSGQHEADEEK